MESPILKKWMFRAFLAMFTIATMGLYICQVVEGDPQLYSAAPSFYNEVRYDWIFSYDEVKKFNFYIDDQDQIEMADYGDLIDFMESSQNPSYVRADLMFEGVEYQDVGIRYKGVSSLYSNNSNKISYKIDFDKYVNGQTLYGLEELNLNCNFGDPSQMREVLAYFLYSEAGVPVSLTGFAEVYINDQYIGLYTMVENVDEQYLERNFGNSDGALFKALNFGVFEYLGEDEADYVDAYEMKNGDGWEEFIGFLDDVNYGDYDAIQEKLDVYGFLDYLALTYLMGNMDSYLVTGHNYYVYELDGVYTILPWDANEAFGGFGDYYDNIIWEVDYSDLGRPLFTHLMTNPDFQKYFDEKVDYYMQFVFNNFRLDPVIDQLFELIDESVEMRQGSEFDYDQFVASMSEDIFYEKPLIGYEDGQIVDESMQEYRGHGLKSYIEARVMWLVGR